ncbi:MAG: hypothetical protein ICV72_15025 [Aldersonia sp.]|nr:hypothetical protein [Aldersonia sp.]
MTWSVGGGGEWRFTQHVYPSYIVAAIGAIAALVQVARAAAARRLDVRRRLTVRTVAYTAATGLTIAAGWAWYRYAPLAVFRETIAAGEAANIAAGDRDEAFFVNGWSPPRPPGTVIVRAALSDRASITVPVPRRMTSYRVTLRMDPAETADPVMQPRVTAYFNGRIATQLHLGRHEGRVGTYRFIVPPDMADWHIGRLDLVASHTVPAADAGLHFTWLPPTMPVAFRLWYVRVEPGVTLP